MPQKSSHGGAIQQSSLNRESSAKKANQLLTLSQEELERGILEVLKKHATTKGLTNSELLKKCGSLMKRSFAVLFKRKEVGAEDVKGFLYDLWRKGLVFFEPPNRGQRVGRIWGMESARTVFPLACPSTLPLNGPKHVTDARRGALKAAYDKFVPEHLGGFVPIFKVRRELGWSTQTFDSLLQDLNERDDPLVELHAADPADLTEGERRDSLRKGTRLLVRMRWREP
jgi:hypothetical protein